MKKCCFMFALLWTVSAVSAQTIDFKEQIEPILNKHCVECHGAEEPEHDIRLDDREAVFAQRRLVVPGNPDRSELYYVLTLPMDDEHHMPPKDMEQLSAEQIEHVRLWLEQGAHWPDGKINFWTQVKPILDQHCVGCHGGEEPEHEVGLDDREAALAKRGLIVPGNPDRSELIQVLSLPMDDEHHMPPVDEQPLTPEQIETLTVWVAQGAVWPETVDYATVIQPILAEKCFRCHGTGRARGGLRLIDHASATAGGERGPAIVPGDPDKSLALQFVQLPADHDNHMPRMGGPLTANQIALLKIWIEQGANYGEEAVEAEAEAEAEATE